MKYDVIIIGAGPAGLTAAIYAARYKMNTIIISKDLGGLASSAHKVCNFPSYPQIKGFELMQKINEQVKNLGISIVYEEIINIEKINKVFSIFTSDKKYIAKKIIFAAGTERQRLNIPGEGKFLGKGISYCTTCDAGFFENKNVVVIGGSDAALSSALLLAEFASKIYIIYRGEKFYKADPTWIELVHHERKIKTLFNEEVIEIIGENSVSEIKLKSGKSMKIDGVFIEVGSIAQTSLLKNINVKLNEKGYIITDKSQKTNIKGLFAAGDITNNFLKQIVTASAEGAIAAFSAYKEIKEESSEDK